MLYKYFPSERVSILKDRKVRFSQFAALNDPFEFLVDIDQTALAAAFDEISEEVWLKEMNPAAVNEKIKRGVMERINSDPRMRTQFNTLPPPMRSALMRQMEKMIEAEAPARITEARQTLEAIVPMVPEFLAREFKTAPASMVLIFSCAENATSVPMWAHYSGNHTGFQIGFDPMAMFNLNTKDGTPICPRKVRYDDRVPIVGRNLDEVSDFVTQKMKDWAYEQEWRFVWTNKDRESAPDAVHLFDFNLIAITEITLGLNASAETEQEIRSALLANGVRCALFRIRRGSQYGFEKTPLAFD